MSHQIKKSEFHIDNETSLRSLFGETHPLAVKKCLPRLDSHCQQFVSLSPFLCLSTQHADGTADVSPRGDPPGFVQILDANTIAIPDRPGNNRLDSLSNIISNPSVGILFLVPGFEDTLRVNGQAYLDRAPALLSTMLIKGRTPTLAIVVDVKEAFLHCAKALRRSRLWRSDSVQDRGKMPSLAAMVTEQTTGSPVDALDLPLLEEDLEKEYKETMY